MTAVFKREVRAYFQSPLGYVFVAVMYFFTAYYFFTYNLYNNTTDMSSLFNQLFSRGIFPVWYIHGLVDLSCRYCCADIHICKI